MTWCLRKGTRQKESKIELFLDMRPKKISINVGVPEFSDGLSVEDMKGDLKYTIVTLVQGEDLKMKQRIEQDLSEGIRSYPRT